MCDMDAVMMKLNSMTSYMESLGQAQDEMKKILTDQLDEVNEVIEDHEDRIGALESKIDALFNKEKLGEEMSSLKKENERRKKLKKLELIQKEFEEEGEMSFAEKLKKNLADDAGWCKKKKENYLGRKNKKEKEENNIKEVIKKSKRIVGMKPVEAKHVDYWIEKRGITREQAERVAAQEFLQVCMNVPAEEVQSIKIYKTKQSKGKKILYVETDEENVIELFRRGSKAKNREYSLINFIPPQIFARYRKAQDICSMLRERYQEKQFTVRIEQKDISIKSRDKEDKFWKEISAEFIHELPDFEVDKEWDGLENVTDRKEYEEFTPGKNKRESDGVEEETEEKEELEEIVIEGSNQKKKEEKEIASNKRKDVVTPPKGGSPKKQKE